MSEEREPAAAYEQKKPNHGKPIDIWQLDFSVYNGSGKRLDHLIAIYRIEAEDPPCTNWSMSASVDYPLQVQWGGAAGHIQPSGNVAPGETVAATSYVYVFHEHEPRFETWSVDYTFAPEASTPAAAPAPEAPAARAAANPGSRAGPPGAPAAPAGGRSGAAAPTPGAEFSDCDACPRMVVVPAGTFTMGSPASEEGRFGDEGPQHSVTIPAPFAVGVYEVTFAEWDACVHAGGCGGNAPDDSGLGRGSRPVINVNWDDAQMYVSWLSQQTGARYRLLSEAEWEYVARAGSRTARYWGESESGQCRYANGGAPAPCPDGYEYTAPVGSYAPNAFGLYDVLGNVWEWTQDCWNRSYAGAPTDGSAWQSGQCGRRVLRGGSWGSVPGFLRSANRYGDSTDGRGSAIGFRVAWTLN